MIDVSHKLCLGSTMRLHRFVKLIAVTVCMSCSDSSGPGSSFSGDYALITSGGSALPILVGVSATTYGRVTSGSVVVMPNRRFSRFIVREITDGVTVFETDTIYYSDSASFYRRLGQDVHFYRVIRLPGADADTSEMYSGTLSSDGSALTVLTSAGGGFYYVDEYER